MRASVIGLYTSGQFVGLAFLTPLLAFIENRYGWRMVFYFTGVVGLLWSVIWMAVYRDPDGHQIVGAGSPPHRFSHESNHSFMKDLVRVLSSRRLWGIYIGQFGLTCTLWFFLTWFPIYLTQYRHIKLDTAGALASLPFLAAFLGVLISGSLSDLLLRRGHSLTVARKLPVIAGLVLASCIGFASTISNTLGLIACLSIAFFGCGFASISWSLVSLLAPPGLIGLTGGVFNFFSSFAAISVPIVIGWLIRGENFAKPFAFISGMALLGIVSYVFLVGRIPSDAGDYAG